jgi:hypothetical protein
MEIKPSEGIAQILELIGSVTVAAPADYTKNIHVMKQEQGIYMGKVKEAVKHAATWVKITKPICKPPAAPVALPYCTRRSTRIRLRRWLRQANQ